MNSKTKKKPGSIVLSVISVILAVIFMTPILWSLAVSFQREGKQINSILDWFTPPYTFQNYPDLILGSDVTKWLFNSVFIAVLTTVLTVILSAMAAYALAKIKFKGSSALYFYFLLGLMVPGKQPSCPFLSRQTA